MLMLDSEAIVEYFILGAWIRGPYNVHQIARVLAHHSEKPPLYSNFGQYELKRAVSHTIKRSRAHARKDHSGSSWFWSEIWSPNKLSDRLLLRTIHQHMESMLDSPTWLPQMTPWTPALPNVTATNADYIVGQSDVDGRATSSGTTTGSEDFLAFYTPMSTPGNMARRLSASEMSMADISDEFDKLDERNGNSITRPYAAETSQHSVQGLPSSKYGLPFDAKGTIDTPFEYPFHQQTQESLSGEIPSTGTASFTNALKILNSRLPGDYFPGETMETVKAPQNSPAATNERGRHGSYLGAFNNEAYCSAHPFWNHPLADANPVTSPHNSLPINKEKSIVNPFNYQTTVRTAETSKYLPGMNEEEKRHAYYVKTFHGHPSERVAVARGHSRGVPKTKKVATPKQKYRKSNKEGNVSPKKPKDEVLGVHFSGLGEEGHLVETSGTGTIKNRRRAVNGDGMTPGLESSRRRLKLVRMDATLGTLEERAHQLGSLDGGAWPGQDDEGGDDKPKHHYKVVKPSAVKDPGVDTTALDPAIGHCVAESGHLAEHTIGHADPNHDEMELKNAVQGVFQNVKEEFEKGNDVHHSDDRKRKCAIDDILNAQPEPPISSTRPTKRHAALAHIMADDPGEADDERAVELSSISAIYPELLIDSTDPFKAAIDIPVEPIKPLNVLFPPPDGRAVPVLPTPPDSDSQHQSVPENDAPVPHPQPVIPVVQDLHELSHLPPLRVFIELPPGYPDTQPPVLKVTTGVSWLSKETIKKLEEDGSRLWEEMGRTQVLFAYIDHLREVAENGFGIASPSTEPLKIAADLKIELLDYDIRAKQMQFNKATFECGVCLEPKKGAVCHRMNLCGHVFCVECLQDFFNSCITEGDVTNVKCITPKCGQGQEGAQDTSAGPANGRRKRDRTLGPSELLQIPLEQEMVQRYVMLKRKKALESDRTTVYCPRQWCQGAARSKKTEALDRNLDLESEDEDEAEPEEPKPETPDNTPAARIPPAERLAICTECSFAFCKVCKASWHGELIICDPQRKAKLTAEEKASEEYMKLHTSPCPTCNAKCQKTHGCNHMICFKCNTHFCYLCSSWLDSGNPYQHFNDRKYSCYMRLWELEGGDGAGIGQGFAGGERRADNDDDDDDDIGIGLFGQQDDDDENNPPEDDEFESDDDEDDEIDPPPPPPPANAHAPPRQR
ncbi:MAG: hypothetical protein Q9212_006428, partial [Teloschistes hypoglaucus]